MAAFLRVTRCTRRCLTALAWPCLGQTCGLPLGAAHGLLPARHVLRWAVACDLAMALPWPGLWAAAWRGARPPYGAPCAAPGGGLRPGLGPAWARPMGCCLARRMTALWHVTRCAWGGLRPVEALLGVPARATGRSCPVWVFLGCPVQIWSFWAFRYTLGSFGRSGAKYIVWSLWEVVHMP